MAPLCLPLGSGISEADLKTGSIALIGSTGSIGVQTLDVCSRLGIRIASLAAGSSVGKLEEQIRRFAPKTAALADEDAARDLKTRVADTGTKILSGDEGVAAAAQDQADVVLNAAVGLAGLRPTIAAIDAGRTLALANKESLVTGGELVIRLAAEKGVRIIPVDSEHSAIFQCLQGCVDPEKEIKRIILTASGGPFFGWDRDKLRGVTPEQALRHPNWSMGRRITTDCATMMNKGMELIEAVHLFGVSPEQVEVTVQRESVIHSAVEFADGAVIAQLGVPDMRIPIQYALTYPERMPSPAAPLDLFKTGTLHFARPDEDTFRCLRVCREAIKSGPLVPAAANGADEEAVKLFLERKIRFTDIGLLVEEAAQRQAAQGQAGQTIENIYEADAQARRFVAGRAESIKG
jgi:1-deoxy-D-xylulose-5-phosphate reductoisomerase